MKFSTRARYGLRMMVELARALGTEEIVRLGRIARITGISVNYLAQLAIPLKNNGLLIGVSGKHGGYRLAKPAHDIAVSDIIEAVQGPIGLTDCARNPDICLNADFCEARMIWVILSSSLTDILRRYTLADLIDKGRMAKLRQEYAHLLQMDIDKALTGDEGDAEKGCPTKADA